MATALLPALLFAAQHAPPPFSWRTVPVFAETSNVSGPFDSAALDVLQKFPLFVAEKAYDYAAPGFAEDKLARLAAQLRERNPAIFLVFYYNANLDMDDYRINALSAAAAPTWWLRNASGVPFVAPVDSGLGAEPPFPYAQNELGGLHVWDHTLPAVREAWVQVNAVACTRRLSPGLRFHNDALCGRSASTSPASAASMAAWSTAGHGRRSSTPCPRATLPSPWHAGSPR